MRLGLADLKLRHPCLNDALAEIGGQRVPFSLMKVAFFALGATVHCSFYP
jgi:hypothetical protein